MEAHRMKRLMLALVLVLPAIYSTPAGALTLPEAESLALENHRRIRLAEQDLQRAQAEVTGSRARMMPSVSASAGYNRNLERPVFFAPPPMGQIEIGEVNEHSLTLSATQPLFLGYAGVTGYRLAQTGLERAELSAEQTQQDVRLGVRQAYTGSLLARAMVLVQQEAVAQAESSLVQIQRLYDVGQASGFDLLQAEVQLANTRPALVSAQSERRLADARLRSAIGLDPGTPVEPSETLAPFTSRWADMSLNSLIDLAARHRPELLELPLQKRAAQDGVRLSRSAYYPDVVLMGRISWQGQSEKLVPDDLARSAAAGVQLSWTLWDSWRSQSGVQQAQVAARQAELSAAMIREGVELEIEATRENLHEAAANITSQATTVKQAEEALRLARVRYDNGTGTQLDLLNAQFVLTQTQTAYASSIYAYHMAHARLEKALGVIGQSLTEHGETTR